MRLGSALSSALLALTATATFSPAGARAEAFTESLVLETRAHDVPPGAPTLIAHAGPAFDPARPFDVVLFVHGWNGCVNVLVRGGDVACRPGQPTSTGWDLAGAFDRAATNALLLAPQLAYRVADGRPGELARAGAARRMIDEALVALGSRVAGKRVGDVARVIVVAHSAGFMAALAVMRRGGLGDALARVVLMDALYDVPSAFYGWLRERPHRAIVAFHTAGRTARNDAALVAFAQRDMPDRVAVDPNDLRDAVSRMRLVVARARVGHGDVPATYFPDVLGPAAR